VDAVGGEHQPVARSYIGREEVSLDRDTGRERAVEQRPVLVGTGLVLDQAALLDERLRGATLAVGPAD
jgi:hypothetical protein